MYRSFFPIYSLYLTAFHLMMMDRIFSKSGPLWWNDPFVSSGGYPIAGEWVPLWVFLSSAVLMHSLLTALERFANFWLTRRVKSPLQRRDTSEFYSFIHGSRSQGPGQMEGRSAASSMINPRASRLLAKPFPIEGMPLFGFGFIEWCLLFFALTALFFLQVISSSSQF